ncbi:hypothetical protein E2562_004021 [Oryza meyeriana var. granulata]|uniref:Uncharacterized protein n=1 Tax=Oryza meyeriana var. granulata TaxID=110450 RepID=A0A6G1BIB2_9ORYZ|nr:hypothetical protein E2562_004021 [Oryza meyeriana var. granulata]
MEWLHPLGLSFVVASSTVEVIVVCESIKDRATVGIGFGSRLLVLQARELVAILLGLGPAAVWSTEGWTLVLHRVDNR